MQKELEELSDANRLLQDSLIVQNWEVAKMAADHIAHLCRLMELDRKQHEGVYERRIWHP